MGKMTDTQRHDTQRGGIGGVEVKVRVKSCKEVCYFFPKETTWSLHVDGIPGYLWYCQEDRSQESDYEINYSLQRRKTKSGRMERDVSIYSKISSKENTLSFVVRGPKRLLVERQKEIDVIKSVISAIVLEATHDK